MATGVSATRNIILRSHGHGNTASSQDHDRVRFPDSPELSPQFAFKCLDDRQPTSSSEDEPSDVTADESGSQGPKPPGFTAVTSLNERPADESDGDERRMPDELPNRRSRSSSWTDLDLSVIVVIITPFVNWLTGSDHLKNLFLVLFLIVYLQQLIQVPWELYNAARRRRPHPSFQSLHLQESDEAAINVNTRRAADELRRHEFAYLFISMITPFVGAALLRTVLELVNGVDSISWFSTTLFVLAAGIRPWGHLISRLREHTTSLHDSIHYPSPDTQLIADSRLQTVVDRVVSLEQELSMVKRAMALRAHVEDVHDDINRALENAAHAIRKQERKSDSTRISNDARLATLEKAVSRIERARGERVRGMVSNGITSNTTDNRAYNPLESITVSIFRFLRAVANCLTFNYFDPPSLPASPNTPLTFMAPRPPLHHAKVASRLETIEEDATEPVNAVRPDDNSRSPKHTNNGAPLLSHQRDSVEKGHLRKSRNIVDIADVVSLPYRLAVGILVAISPPLQRFFG
ncbi:hypothetical protein BGW80DRAFT_1456794 [Lactifluus volemus]|nr:hypothetical protein BGW80DRAFT_1456794 [Lactifluus volemus]